MYRPERMCAVCRTKKDKSELIRIVRSPEGVFSLDGTGNSPGRGAYLCRSEKCLTQCVKKRLLNRVFKAEVPEEIYEAVAGMCIEDK